MKQLGQESKTFMSQVVAEAWRGMAQLILPQNWYEGGRLRSARHENVLRHGGGLVQVLRFGTGVGEPCHFREIVAGFRNWKAAALPRSPCILMFDASTSHLLNETERMNLEVAQVHVLQIPGGLTEYWFF